MSSGEETFSLPLNRQYGYKSLVAPEAATAAERLAYELTAISAAPTLPTHGFPVRSADEIAVVIRHNGDGAADGAYDLYVYHESTGEWAKKDRAETIHNDSASVESHIKETDCAGADRVAVAVTALPNAATFVKVWLLGRNAKPTV